MCSPLLFYLAAYFLLSLLFQTPPNLTCLAALHLQSVLNLRFPSAPLISRVAQIVEIKLLSSCCTAGGYTNMIRFSGSYSSRRYSHLTFNYVYLQWDWLLIRLMSPSDNMVIISLKF